jgi:hypothetical protein
VSSSPWVSKLPLRVWDWGMDWRWMKSSARDERDNALTNMFLYRTGPEGIRDDLIGME